MKNKEQWLTINVEEMHNISGGDFAYDFGFFLREIGISVLYGGFESGAIAVANDLALNYRPLD